MLKGSLLCADHAVRYMVHGTNGSWRKEGMDPQEALLMTGIYMYAYVTFSLPSPLPGSSHHSLTAFLVL